MKSISQDYKENIKSLGRELDTKITYTLNNSEIELGVEQLNSVTPHYEGNILKSVMKQLDLDSNVDIPIGTLVNCRFGVKVSDNDYDESDPTAYRDNYEYINFGNYIVYSSEKLEATNSYKIVCYDKMLYSMKNYETFKKPTTDTTFTQDKKYYNYSNGKYVLYEDERTGNPTTLGLYEDANITYPITIRNYINALCNHINLTFANSTDTFPNYDKEIPNELYLDENGNSLNYTFRDVLSELAQVTASTICINSNDELELRYINETNDAIDEEYFKDVNVNFGELYGPINTISFKRSADSDVVSLSNPVDLADKLKNEISISDNQILNGSDRSDYLQDILNQLYGLSYYINDFASTGITYYELCDKYNAQIEGNTYPCIMLNDEINITQGLEENIHTDLPKESETDYNTTTQDDRTRLRTEFIVNKQQGTITGIVSEQDELEHRVSQTELNITSQGAKIGILSTNIDEETGDVLKVKTTSYELSEDGFVIDDGSGFKSIDNTTGKYYYDNDVMIGKYTKDGSVQKDMALFGKYYYGIEEDVDVETFSKDDAMFVAQLYEDENGETAFGHFSNK